MAARQLKALAGLAEDPLGSSQPPLTLVPDDPSGVLPGLLRHQASTGHRHAGKRSHT